MRLDKFLKVSRLIKRRTQAQIACENDRVFVNNRVAKSSTTVKVGDEIILVSPVMRLRVKVIQVPESNRVNGDLFTVLEETRMSEEGEL